MFDENSLPIDDNSELKRTQIEEKLSKINDEKFFEKFFSRLAIESIRVPEQVLLAMRKTREKIKSEVSKVDYVIVTGRSRSVARSLLIGAGISEEKIIEFDNTTNGIVYKKDSVENDSLTSEERLKFLESKLQAIFPNDGKKKSALLFDDITDTGLKAWHYLSLFRSSSMMSSTKFLTLSGHSEKKIEAAEDYFSYFQATFAPNVSDSYECLYPLEKPEMEQNEAIYNYLLTLSTLCSSIDKSSLLFRKVPEDLLPTLHQALEYSLDQIADAVRRK